MRFAETPIPGMFEVMTDIHRDERGGFARLYCRDSFDAAGIAFEPVQDSLSLNRRRHTLRGLHFQSPPHAEAKLVRCLRGRVFDVAVDLRPGPGYGRWHAVTLDARRMSAAFLPAGLAHGFLTLTADAAVLYHIDRAHVPGKGRGLAWDDPDLAIAWPSPPALMSAADRAWPRLRDL